MTLPRTPLLLALLLCAAAAPAQQRADRPAAPATLNDRADVLGVVFPASVSQGAMVIGKVPAGSRVRHAGRDLRVTGYGSVVFGVGRDEAGPVQVEVQPPGAPTTRVDIAVTKRDWPIQRINGVPPATVNPPKAIAERIAREQAQVSAVRTATTTAPTSPSASSARSRAASAAASAAAASTTASPAPAIRAWTSPRPPARR